MLREGARFLHHQTVMLIFPAKVVGHGNGKSLSFRVNLRDFWVIVMETKS